MRLIFATALAFAVMAGVPAILYGATIQGVLNTAVLRP